MYFRGATFDAYLTGKPLYNVPIEQEARLNRAFEAWRDRAISDLKRDLKEASPDHEIEIKDY